jgi:drug/metabolite transporter (DMT)-like permease
VALALLVTATGLAQFEALQRTAVVNVVAIKRLSTLFSAVVGVTVFGEYGGALRLGAAALMLGGAALVLTGGGS